MQGDPRLEEWGIYPPGHPKALAQMGEVMWKMARHMEGVVSACSGLPLMTKLIGLIPTQHIHTLSLRGNRLSTLRQLHHLAVHLPHITALDLSDNEGISNIKELDVICGRADGANSRVRWMGRRHGGAKGKLMPTGTPTTGRRAQGASGDQVGRAGAAQEHDRRA